MYKLYVTKSTRTENGIVSNVIEFDTKEAADLAFDRLKNCLYVSVVKLY